MNYITTYSDYILNETLKTLDIDITISSISSELSLQRYNFTIIKNVNNTFSIELLHFNTVQNYYLYLNNLDSLSIDRFGWFPTKMKIFDISGMVNELSYDEDYLIDKGKYFKSVKITYEAKYDLEINIPPTLYHLSIQEYENKVLKNGLVPKSKSKLTKHLDRIYLCDSLNYCKILIPRMNLHYSNKDPRSKINGKWIIYEIDTTGLDIKLYKDPNCINGYYCVDNIPCSNINIIDKEI